MLKKIAYIYLVFLLPFQFNFAFGLSSSSPTPEVMYTFRRVVIAEDKTPKELYDEVVQLLWKDPLLKSEHIDAYMALWNVTDNYGGTDIKGKAADIQFSIKNKDAEGIDVINKYIQNHQGILYRGYDIRFSKVDSFLAILSFNGYTKGNYPIYESGFAMFQTMTEAIAFMNEARELMVLRDLPGLLKKLTPAFNEDSLKKIEMNFDKCDSIGFGSQFTLMKLLSFPSTHEVSLYGYQVNYQR